MKRTFSITLPLNLLILSTCSLLPAADDYPLAEAGPYQVGIRKMIGYEDSNRGGRGNI
jgi:hypothetical protein